jgi:hypothetical protein
MSTPQWFSNPYSELAAQDKEEKAEYERIREEQESSN